MNESEESRGKIQMKTINAFTVLGVIFLSAANLCAVDKPLFHKACMEDPGSDPAFATAFVAALTAKQVPITVLGDCGRVGPEVWRIDLSSTEKQESTARAWLLNHYRTDTASITIKDGSGAFIWGYNVTKINSRKYQSTAEACAKHLKNDLIKKTQ